MTEKQNIRRVPVVIGDANAILQKVVDSNLDVGKLAMIGKTEYRQEVDAWIAEQRSDIAEVEKGIKETKKQINELCQEAAETTKQLFNSMVRLLSKGGFSVRAELTLSCPHPSEIDKEKEPQLGIKISIRRPEPGNCEGLYFSKAAPLTAEIRRLLQKQGVLEKRMDALDSQLRETELHKEIRLAEFGEQLEADLYKKRLEGQKDGLEVVNVIQAMVLCQVKFDQAEVKKLTARSNNDEED